MAEIAQRCRYPLSKGSVGKRKGAEEIILTVFGAGIVHPRDPMCSLPGMPGQLVGNGRNGADPDMGIAPADHLNFVAIDNRAISEFYGAPEMLDASDYAWAKDGVSTVAVTAALTTCDYRTNRQKCDYVGRITNLIHDGIDELRATGHAKWRSVDLDATVAGWDTSACASEALHKRGNTPGGSADPAFRNFLDEMKQTEQ